MPVTVHYVHVALRAGRSPSNPQRQIPYCFQISQTGLVSYLPLQPASFLLFLRPHLSIILHLTASPSGDCARLLHHLELQPSSSCSLFPSFPLLSNSFIASSKSNRAWFALPRGTPLALLPLPRSPHITPSHYLFHLSTSFFPDLTQCRPRTLRPVALWPTVSPNPMRLHSPPLPPVRV